MTYKGRIYVTGYFITLEGGEGAGKTTVIRYVEEALLQQGYDVLVTREPGGIRIAEEIRQIILHPEHTEMEGRTEALLYAAARRQHLVERIIPALEQGKIVLCDRFIDSSLAYQGYARGIGMEEVLQINNFAIDGLMPHLTLFFDLPPAVGLERIAVDASREQNRLDLEKLAFHEKVYEGYKQVVKQFPKRIHAIDARNNKEVVRNDAYEIITHYINEREGEST